MVAPLRTSPLANTPGTIDQNRGVVDRRALALDEAGIAYELETVGGYRSLHWTRRGDTRAEIRAAVGDGSRFGASVPFVDLDTLLPPGERIALLKCDIEGAEEIFLENYPQLFSRVDRAVFELHYDRCNVDRCVDLLDQAGLTRRTVIRDCRPEYSVDLFER